MILQRNEDGTVTALTDPDEFVIADAVLTQADPALVTVTDDEITLHLTNGDRTYRFGPRTHYGWTLRRSGATT